MANIEHKLATKILSLTGRPDRATDRAVETIEIAVAAANEFGDDCIDSRHLLCGLFREGHGVAFHVLSNLGLTRTELEMTFSSHVQSAGKLPASLDDDVPLVMAAATDSATSMNHNYIGTEHLLLGIVAPGTKSVKLLTDLGINDESVVHEVRGLMGDLP